MGSVEITSEVIAFRRSEVQDRRMPPDGLDRALVEMVRSAWRADYSSWLDENAGPYVGDRLPGCAVSNSQVEWTKRDMLRTSLKAVLDCNLAMLETDFRAELTDVTVPTLIIQGDHDASIPLELSAKERWN
jgi:non-heme chloroperoxidase